MMKAEDVNFLKGQNKKSGKSKNDAICCVICGKPLDTKNSKKRWFRILIDLRKSGFRNAKTVALLYAGAYCSNEHLLIGIMKATEELPEVEP